jgi:hypothetical protein
MLVGVALEMGASGSRDPIQVVMRGRSDVGRRESERCLSASGVGIRRFRRGKGREAGSLRRIQPTVLDRTHVDHLALHFPSI